MIAATSLSSVVAAERKRPDKSNTYKVNSSATVINKGSDDNSMNMYKNSDFIEKEQPELNDETKQLISAYQKNPTLENYVALREMVIVNYNAVLDKKEAKLAELKQETEGKPGGEDKVAEMNEIVQEMYVNYWSRIKDKMFERFYRADSTSSKVTGHGLGLAIAKNIVDNSRGKIDAKVIDEHSIEINVIF